MANKDKKIENEVVEEITVEEETEVVEVKTGKKDKVVGFAKKHGKKILGGIVGAGALVAAYALGAKTHEDDEKIIDGEYFELVETTNFDDEVE